MVAWNPLLPNAQDPNYLNYSKPISDIPADKSKALAISAAGDALEGAVTVAERIDQDIIKDKTRAGVDALRGATTASYEEIRRAQIQGTAPDPAAARAISQPLSSLMDANASMDVPDSLQAGLDRAENIGTARAQGGVRANDTLYTSALNSLAKQLRSEFPGHKDFIDEQISRISGKNPANAYMENLLADINMSARASNGIEKKWVQKAFENSGAPGMRQYIAAYEAKLPGSYENLQKAAAAAESKKWQHQEWQRQNTESKGDQDQDAALAKYQAQSRADDIAFRNFKPVLEIPGLTSPEQQQKMLDDYRAGRLFLTPDQHGMLLNNATATLQKAEREINETFVSEGYRGRIRDPNAETAITNNSLKILRAQVDAINSKDYGTLFDLQRRNTARQDMTNFQVGSSDIGEFLRVQSAIKDKTSPEFSNFLSMKAIEKGYLGKFQNFFQESMNRAVASDDVRQDGVVKSLYADLAKARELAKKEAQSGGAKMPPKMYDDLVDNVNLILSAKDKGQTEAAIEVVKYTFDPTKNARIMEFFGRDYTDSQGKFHKGKFAVYDNLTRPSIVDAVWGLGDKTAWNTMKQWSQLSFRNLFAEEITNLNKVYENGTLGPNKVNWDNENHRFFLSGPDIDKIRKFPPGTPAINMPAGYAYLIAAEESMNKLNNGLNNLSYLKRKEGSDTSAYLADQLMFLGFRPGETQGTLPQAFADAIAASRKPKSTIEGVDKATR